LRAGSKETLPVTSTAPDFAELQFSTEDVPPRDRIAFFRDVIGAGICRLNFEQPARDRPFAVSGVLRALPGLGILSATASGIRAERTPELMADGNDDIIMSLFASGTNTVQHLGREETFASGEASLLSNADGGIVIHDAARFVALRLSRAAIALLVPGLEDTFMRRIPRDSEALRLLTGYLSLLRDNDALASPEVRRMVVTHVYDLAALVIGAGRDAAALAAGRGLAAARLRAVKAHIAEHLDDAGLSVAAVAARQRVTPRYVQMLFETEGTTFSHYVLGQRLVRAHRMLGDPRCVGLSVTTIAFEAGFGDLSYFHRTFRRAYGASPSDVRVAVHKGG
jgi:AraC-like DNA-binding protein